MSAPKKYYWLRLKRDFFKRHDTRIIEGMENGEKYILFYLKLLVESIDHEGSLRFSDTIPYNEKMLATITNTDVDIVRSAVKIFTELEMMERMDDGTLFMAHVNTMIGAETEWAEKKRIYRGGKQLSIIDDEDTTRTLSGQIRTQSDKRLEKEYRVRDKREEVLGEEAQAPVPSIPRFKKPTLEELAEYCTERKNTVDAQRFLDHYESNGWMVGKTKMMSWKAAVRTWEANEPKAKPKPEYKEPEATPIPEEYRAMLARTYEAKT